MTGNANVRRGAAVFGTAVLLLAGCGSPSERAAEDGGGEEDDVVTLRVGATPVPHAQVLEFVDEELAADVGLAIEVVEYTDYNQPNAALAEGELDANYYQTRPFLEEYLEGDPGADLEYVGDVHLEAFGLYSEEVTDLGDLPEGAEIAVPNDVSNLGRALNLLAEHDVITLAGGTGGNAAESDIEDNPMDITFTQVEAAQLPRSLQDVDAAVVNGNYALEANLAETANALAWEETEGSVYGNGLVVRSEDVEAEDMVRLNELLHGPEVREFMEERWKGIVVPMGVDEE